MSNAADDDIYGIDRGINAEWFDAYISNKPKWCSEDPEKENCYWQPYGINGNEDDVIMKAFVDYYAEMAILGET